MSESKLFDAKDLLNGLCSHQEYYAQFVTYSIKECVLYSIGLKRLLASTDEHLNDIPLRLWDSLPIKFNINVKLQKQLNNVTYGETDREKFSWSQSQSVYIAKAAARIIIEENRN